VSVSRSGPPDGVTGAADAPSRSPAEIEALTTEAIERADRRIEAALGDPQDAKALLRALDDAGRIVALAYGQGAFLRYVHPDPDGRDAAAEAAERFDVRLATPDDQVRERDSRGHRGVEDLKDAEGGIRAPAPDHDPRAGASDRERLVDSERAAPGLETG
jgi:hypothetical protein